MPIEILEPAELHRRAVSDLGLDADLLTLEAEAAACALRRAAGFLCPCPPRTLIRSVAGAFEPVVPEAQELVRAVLEAVVAYGDLQEHASGGKGGAVRLLYATPPSFVRRKSGTVYLLGVKPEAPPLSCAHLGAEVDHVGHVRRIPSASAGVVGFLRGEGYTEIREERWLKAPKPMRAGDHVASYVRELRSSGPAGDLAGLQLLDPERDITFYPKRWVQPRTQTGTFVARRAQAYGADLWSFVEVEQGHPRHLLDLPTRHGMDRGCDEAWRLQAAIDAARGHPQRYRVETTGHGKTILNLYSPIPQWLGRRWDVLGERLPRRPGSLISYAFDSAEVEQEAQFAEERLWLSEKSE